MPAPVIAATTFVDGNAVGSSQVLQKPTGVIDTDLLLAILSVEHNGSGTLLSPPSGWLNAPDAPAFQAVSNGTACYVWYKVITAASGEPSSYTFPVQSSRWRRGGILRIGGADNANPFDGGDGAVLANGSSTPAVSVTTTGVDRLCIWTGVSYELSAWSNLPSGFTEITAWASSSAVSTAASRTVATSGTAVGAAVATGVSTGKAAWVGAIRPAPSGPEPGRFLIAY